MRLIPDLTPPGGWVYVQPETGHRMVSINLHDLRHKIEIHRRANRLDLFPGWWDELQVEMCARPELASDYCGDDLPKEVVRISMVDLLRFFRTVREWVFKRGFPKVSPEEANRREQICLSCPKNQEVKGCGGCQGVTRWLGEFISAEEMTRDPRLKNCEVCKCVLSLKVHMPKDVLDQLDDGLTYPNNCWINASEQP